MSASKKIARQRRAVKTRAKIKSLGVHRLVIHRTPRHIYAQIQTPDGATTLVSASTLDTAVSEGLEATGNIAAAEKVGQMVGSRAKDLNITSVAFDRAGFRYHGRVKALADAARAAGLEF